MAEENEENNSVDPATVSVRRKRGRPRKDDVSGSEPGKRSRRQKVDPNDLGYDPLVGRVVSGVLDGKFDAGYMLTVQVGDTGAVFRGVVFEPGLSIPISAANDIAPNVKMLKREEIPIPTTQLQSKLPIFTHIRPVVKKDGVLKHYQRNEYALSSKGTPANSVSEYLTSKVQTHSTEETRMPNVINHAPEYVIQDVRSIISDHLPKDVNQDQPAINAESSKTADSQEAPSDTNLITQPLQPSTSEPKQEQAADTSKAKPLITNGPSGGSGKALPVAVQAPECEPEKMIQPGGNGGSHPTGSSVDTSAVQISDKNVVGNEIAIEHSYKNLRGNETAVDASAMQNSDKNWKGNDTAMQNSDKNLIGNESAVDASAMQNSDRNLVGTDTAADASVMQTSDRNLVGNRTAADASAIQTSDRNLVRNETSEGMSYTGQKPQVHIDTMGSGSKTSNSGSELKRQPSELEPQGLASQDTPVQVEGNMISALDNINQVFSSDTIEATKHSISQSIDAVRGSSED